MDVKMGKCHVFLFSLPGFFLNFTKKGGALPVEEAFLFKGYGGKIRFGVKSGRGDKKQWYCVASLALRKKRSSARLENTSPSADVF